jgi:hypothetical protein
VGSPGLRRFSSTLDGQPPRHSVKHPFETTDGTVTGIVAEVSHRDPGTSSAVLTRLTGQRPRDYRLAVAGFLVERVETVGMTDEQYDQAVNALATLFVGGGWWPALPDDRYQHPGTGGADA